MKCITYRAPAELRRLSACVALAFSAAASLPVLASGTPYSGSPIALPAAFEAENFDAGGEGAGYHDLTPGNLGGLYRTGEDVDIAGSTDSSGGGYVINHFQSGEWLAYTVNVPAAGNYDIALRASNNFGASPAFHVEVDGIDVTGSVPVPSTGNWDTFQWVTRSAVNLPAGQHELRIVSDAQYFNLNTILVSTTPVKGGYAGSPYTGTPIALPSTFEAEDFDKGGEGVAYHDLSKTNLGGQYRAGEDVDIIASTDSLGGGFAVTHFQSGEWLAYSVNVNSAGKYDLSLRLATNYGAAPAFHVEVDGVNVTGSVAVPSTGSWDKFQWVSAAGVDLPAGQHVLKIVADAQYFNLNSIKVSTPVSAYSGTPFSGTPIDLPAAFEAENFDNGGEGVAYHDITSGNIGGQYRTGEDVDIVLSTDSVSVGSNYIVNSFHTGEWLAYTVNVAADGNYDLSVRASNNYVSTPQAGFHMEMDGKDITGKVNVPVTGSWDKYQWVTVPGVSLTAGQHVLKIFSDAQYFNLNALSVLAAGTAPPAPSGPATAPPATSAAMPAAGGPVQFACEFDSSFSDCGFGEQNALGDSPGRASIVSNVSRTGGSALRLHTEPGDSYVHGSGDFERDDMILGPSPSYCNPGQEEWWAHSTLFPDDFSVTGYGYALVDFHHNTGGYNANFHFMYLTATGLRLWGFAGDPNNPVTYKTDLGQLSRNVWYDMVYHVKWSEGSDGFMEAWMNGRKMLTYNGPTLYNGIVCYLKLANYHDANGQPSSVIHDRVMRGTSAAAVALTPLEGVQ